MPLPLSQEWIGDEEDQPCLLPSTLPWGHSRWWGVEREGKLAQAWEEAGGLDWEEAEGLARQIYRYQLWYIRHCECLPKCTVRANLLLCFTIHSDTTFRNTESAWKWMWVISNLFLYIWNLAQTPQKVLKTHKAKRGFGPPRQKGFCQYHHYLCYIG